MQATPPYPSLPLPSPLLLALLAMGNQTWLSLRWRLALVLASLSCVDSWDGILYIAYIRSIRANCHLHWYRLHTGRGGRDGVVEGGNLLVWHIGQTFRGAHIWHESLLRWYLQAAAARNSAPLSTIGPLDLRHIQSPVVARGEWREVEGSGSYVCMHANNTLTTFTRHS